jgi:outer membrane protein assembly factor BamB
VIVEGGNLLFALDAASGQTLWQHRVRIAPAPAPTAPVIDGGRVFLAEVDSTFALDVNTGATLWTFHPDSQGVVVPAVDDASIYIGQRGIPTVYALDKASGALRWRVELSRSYPYAAHVTGLAVGAGALYAAFRQDKSATGALSGGVLVALDPATGRELWRYETTADRGAFVAEPLLVPNAVIVNDYLWGEVISLDRTTHAVRWRSRTAFARVATDGAWVYGAGNDGNAHALSVADGSVRWTTALGSSADGIAVCAGNVWENSGNLHRVDAATGAETGRLGVSGLDIFVSDIGTASNRVFVAGGPYVSAFDCR